MPNLISFDRVSYKAIEGAGRMRMGRIAMAGSALAFFAGAAAIAQTKDMGRTVGAAAGGSSGAAKSVVDTGNGGVAGTGMGKTHEADQPPSSMSGTGNSVKGPPGQGIQGKTQ